MKRSLVWIVVASALMSDAFAIYVALRLLRSFEGVRRLLEGACLQ